MKPNRDKLIWEEAAAWLAKRQAGELTAAQERQLSAWRDSDPRRRLIFRQMEAAWGAFDILSEHPEVQTRPVDADILARPSQWRRLMRPAMLAAAAGIAIGISAWLGSRGLLHRHDVTFVAGADAVAVRLSDDSEAELRAGSEIQEHFTAAERHLRLVRGETLFFVAKNPSRPFIVESNGVMARAVGTAFDVRRDDLGTAVLVTEGTVQVTRATRGGESSILVAGQRTLVPTGFIAGQSPPGVEALSEAQIDQALRWQTLRLVFDDAPLSEVVQRLNRVAGRRENGHRLVLGDDKVGEIRFSGRIRQADIDSFMAALQEDFGVSVQRRSDGATVLRVQPAASL